MSKENKPKTEKEEPSYQGLLQPEIINNPIRSNSETQSSSSQPISTMSAPQVITTDKFEHSIPKLTGDNWQAWKWQIYNILDVKNLRKVLTSEETNTSNELTVRQILSCSLDQKVVNKVIHCQTAQQIWSTLQSSYENKTSFALTDLIGRMNSYRMNNLEQVEKGISEIQSMAVEIRALGGKVDDPTIESAILRALPKSFSPFITSWTFLDQDKRTLNNLQAHLMRQAYIFKSEASESKALVTNIPKSKGKGNKQSAEEKPNPNKSKKSCKYCKKFGHVIEECRKLANKKKREGSDSTKPEQEKLEGSKSPEPGSKSSEPTQVMLVATVVKDSPALNISNLVEGDKIATTWIADTGASFHMTQHIEWIGNYQTFDKAIQIKLGDDRIVEALGKGSVVTTMGVLYPVYYLPDIGENLFSVTASARNHKVYALSTDKDITFMKDQEEILRGHMTSSGIYQINLTVVIPQYTAALSSSLIDWHEKLGHVSFDKIKSMSKNGIVNGLKITDFNTNKCESCALSKTHRCSHPTRTTPKSTVPGEVLHMDTVGPIEPSLGGAKYFVVVKDEYSSYKMLIFVESKSEIPQKIIKLINQVKLETGNKTLKVVSDQGTEFKNHKLESFFNDKGITQVMSNVYTPEQNGLVERENRTIIESARALRICSKLSLSFWAEAVNTATYTLNRVSNSKNPNSTPFELWLGRKPTLSNFRKFGELAMVRVRGNSKFEAKAEPMIFVGYSNTYNTFRFINPKNDGLIISCDVTFMDVMYHSSTHSSTSQSNNSTHELQWSKFKSAFEEQSQPTLSSSSPLISPMQSATDNVQDKSIAPMSTNSSSISDLDNSLQENTEESIYDVPSELINSSNQQNNPDSSVQSTSQFLSPCRSLPPESPDKERMESLRPRTNKPNYMPWKLNLSTAEAENDPNTFEEAMSRPDKDLWLKAMDEEIDSLHKNHVWNLVPRPKGTNIVTNRWVLRIKRKPNGEIERYRARLVARGFSQIHGIDYTLTYAPVVSTSGVRLLLAYAAANRLLLSQFDIKTAFLYGELDECVHMEQPQGYYTDKSKVCLLKRSLYGLKQAPRQWSLKFKAFLLEMKLEQSDHDGCIFHRNNPFVIIAIYVDDGLIIAKDQLTIKSTLTKLKSRFDVHTMDVSTFLGFQIELADDKLFIHQESYINKILTKFHMNNCKPEQTPISATTLSSSSDELLPTDIPYREAVGSLLYAAVTTRIDIAYAVGIASRAVECPKVKHWKLIKRIFRYLSGSRNYGLCYKQSNEKTLRSYCDAAYADDAMTARSTTGTIMFYAGAPIQWRSARQAMVTKSVSEAEYIAICTATTDIVVMRKLALELNIIPVTPTPVLCDNESAVRLANDEKCAHRTRHMHVKMQYSREQIERGEISISHTSGKTQLADTLTKPVTTQSFINFRNQVMSPKSIIQFIAILSIIGCCFSYRFDEVSQIVYQPTDRYVDLGIASYTIDFTFVNPCNVILYQYVISNPGMPMPPVAEDGTTPPGAVQDPIVQAHITECNKIFESTWLLKLNELKYIHSLVDKDPNQRPKRGFVETITVTVVTNFLWKMVERWLPWSEYNRINRLEEQQKNEKDQLLKFSHAFNITSAISNGLIDMVKNNTISLREQQRQIAHIADLTSKYTWLATYLETRMIFATGDLKSILDEYKHGRVSVIALSNLVNLTDISDIDNRDTVMKSIELITPKTLRFKFDVRIRSPNTHVYRVHPVKYWDNLLETPKLLEYQGPKFVIYNASSNCIRGIEEPVERAVIEECNEVDYTDPEIGTWRVLISTDNIRENHKSVSVIRAVDFNYVYCFPYNITIVDGNYRCPTKMFKVPNSIGFTTLNKTVKAVQHNLHIRSEIDKLFLDDVHIGHFPNTSVATTGIEMFDKIQILRKQLHALLSERENSVSMEKYSTTFWFVISLLIFLVITVLTAILYHVSMTKRSHRSVKNTNQIILRDLSDLKSTYESTTAVDVRSALKKTIIDLNNQNTTNTLVNTNAITGSGKPSVEVGGDVTINVHKAPVSRPLPDVPCV